VTQKDSNQMSSLSRRKFLQSAALGMVAINLTPLTRAISKSDPELSIDVISGNIAAIGDTWIDIEQMNDIHRIQIDSNTYFWKGGVVYPNALSIGDDLVARILIHNMLALKLWSNLTRLRGQVTAFNQNGYIIDTRGHGSARQIFIGFNEKTLIGNPAFDKVPERKNKAYIISINDDIDVIGEKTLDGILATTIVHRQTPNDSETSKSVLMKKEDQLSTRSGIGPDATCTTYGHANWFDCPTGHGGCGTCNSSNAYQTAWPSIDVQGCRGRCASDCCDCARNCISIPFKSCGNSVTVYDQCTSKSRTVSIVDCGPNVTAYCSQNCGYPNCSNSPPPIIDLTKPTFTYFRDPDAGWGCFSCRTVVSC
jgi:hypothetical protein